MAGVVARQGSSRERAKSKLRNFDLIILPVKISCTSFFIFFAEFMGRKNFI